MPSVLPPADPAALATARAPSAWRPDARRLVRLLLGLAVFGAGEALLVRAVLGSSPWTVLSQGVALHLPISVGVATQLVGAVVLLLWIPLRQRPGLGTICNVVVIGLAVDATLLVAPDVRNLAVRGVLVLAGTGLVGLGSGAYLGAALGPGPRDGLMTGLHRRTGRPIAAIRAGIELTVLGAGWALGGTVGVGTVAFALLIGPAVQLGIRVDRALRGVDRRGRGADDPAARAPAVS